jgi:hypothetical protein
MTTQSGQCHFGRCSCAAAGADRFPKKVCDLDPEKIRDDQLNLPINGLLKQIHSFLLKRL